MPSPIFPSNPQSHQASNAMKRILPALFALLGPALAALAADNEIQVKAPGSGTGGQLQVTVGISSKTLEAVRRLTGQPVQAPAAPAAGPVQPAVAPVNNQGYIHNAATDF